MNKIIKNCIFIITKGEIVDHIVTERVTVNWSIGSCLTWSSGKKNLHFIDDRNPVVKEFDDISTLIKERAINRYGLEVSHLCQQHYINEHHHQVY